MLECCGALGISPRVIHRRHAIKVCTSAAVDVRMLRYSPAIRSTARSAGSSCRMLRGLSFAHSLRLPSSSNSMIPAAQAVRLLLLHHARVPRRIRLSRFARWQCPLRAGYHNQQHSRPFPGIVYITARRDIEHLRSIRHTCVSTHVRPLRKNVTLTPVIPSLSLSLSSFTPSLVLAPARIAFVSSGTFRRGCEPHHETLENESKRKIRTAITTCSCSETRHEMLLCPCQTMDWDCDWIEI